MLFYRFTPRRYALEEAIVVRYYVYARICVSTYLPIEWVRHGAKSWMKNGGWVT